VEEEDHSSEFDDYTIRYPTTSRDDGSPTDDILKDTNRIFDFIHDERHITAYKLYMDVLCRLKANPSKVTPKQQVKNDKTSSRRKKKKLVLDPVEEAFEQTRLILAKNRTVLETLEKRANVFKRAKKKIQKNDDWILSQTLFGVTTYYRREKDNSLSIKMEGILKGVPLFEQICVIKEVDLHCKWAPFCSSSMTIKDLNKLDTVGWFCVGIPSFGLARDGCFRAIGCDNMMEDGSVIIVGQGLQDREESEPYGEPFLREGVDGLEIPETPTGIGSGRLTIRNFSCVVNVLATDSVETKLVANIDPNMPIIPQSMIDFVMKKLCGVLLYKLQAAAKKAATDPIKNAHARRMRQEHAFYNGWLLPKVKAFCEASSWEMPKIAAFELTDAQLEQEYEYSEKRGNKSFSEDSDQRDESFMHTELSPRSMTQATDDRSTVSALSNASSNAKNPIAKYLKDMERKTIIRKKRRIDQERVRATNRLKPKKRNDIELERLRELKVAKARREHVASGEVNVREITFPTTAAASTTSNVVAPSRQETRHRRSSIADLDVVDTMERFHNHTRKMRFMTMSGLVVCMTLVLWPELFRIPVSNNLFPHHDGLITTFFVNIFTVVYLLICAITHLVVCDVSLVYAFDALELGMKTGKQVKKFYCDSVRLAAASGSGGLVAVSTAKALGTVWTRVFSWYTIRGFAITSSWLTAACQFVGQYMPMFLVTLFSTFWAVVTGSVGFVAGSTTQVVSVIYSVISFILIQSNPIGRGIESSLIYTAGIVSYIENHWSGYVQHLADIYVKGEHVNSWREDAISSTRYLLSHTAAFLLLILVLFNASSRRSKKMAEERLMSQSTSSADMSDMPSTDEMDAARNGNHYIDDDELSVATTVHSNRSHGIGSFPSDTSVISNKSESPTSSLKKKFKNPFKKKKKKKEFAVIPESTEFEVY